MVSRVFSAGLSGIDGYIVTVECFLSGGLPRLDVVGLPTGAVSEAGERVRAAAKACAFDWPVSRLTVNLAPADTKKAGTAYDQMCIRDSSFTLSLAFLRRLPRRCSMLAAC